MAQASLLMHLIGLNVVQETIILKLKDGPNIANVVKLHITLRLYYVTFILCNMMLCCVALRFVTVCYVMLCVML